MLDQVFAKSVRVAHEVSQGARCICSSFLLGIFQKLNEKNNTGPQMLIKDVVVETSIADCKAGKFASIPIAISTALNGSLDQSVL